MQKDIIIINPKSNIAISTLWTKKELILNKLPENIKNKIAIIGTTYSSIGINYILDTLSKFPNIDTIIIYGADLSTSGQTIINVFNKKFDTKLFYPIEQILPIIETTKVIDLREDFKKGNINKLIKTIEENYNPKKVREIIRLNKIEENVESFPYPLSGHYIYETSVFRAWIKILNLIDRFGFLKYSEYNEMQKELLNVMVTIDLRDKNYELEKEFFNYIKREDFDKHIKEILTSEIPIGVEYTYGYRFLKHFGNQIEYIIEKLSKNPYSRRALAITWDFKIDSKSNNPPCIISIVGNISGNYYNHTVFIRSNDMFRGWPVNVVGQIELSKKIIDEINKKANTNYKLGYITTISVSAHIYEHDFNLVKEIIKKYKTNNFIEDPKGNFLIEKTKDGIKLELRAKDGSLIYKDEGNIEKIYENLKGKGLFNLYEHALYLGRELERSKEKNYKQR